MYLSKLMLAQGLLVGAAMACEVVQPNNGGVKIDPTKNEPVKNEPVKNAPVKNAPAKNETVKNDSILEPGVKWEICIHAPIKHDSVDDIIPSEATVFGIDLAHAQEFPDMIPTLKEADKIVLCYYNAGAVQNWDEDKGDFPEAVIGKGLDPPYVGDEGEWYLDIRHPRVLELMKKRLDAAVEIGCDGVDPDNVDAWVEDGDDPTGFSLTPEDYADYLISLAEYAHSLKTKSGGPLLVGQKNAPAIASSLVSVLDFAVLESCREWSFCGDFQPYIQAGKPVFQIEYPPSLEETGSVSDEDMKLFCEEPTDKHGDEGFSRILKWASAQLDGWGQYCGEEPFEQPTIVE